MISKDIARNIKLTSYPDIPPKVIKQAKKCFIDFLGVTLRGSETKSALTIRQIIGSTGKATIIGNGYSNVLEASLANGVAAHSLDLDDGHRKAQIHPGCCVIPAALSLAESENLNGEEFLTSLICGYQTAIFLGMIVNPQHRQRGFHSTATCGNFGAASAAAKCLDLNEEQIINAIGLTGTISAGLLESDHSGSMGKHLHAGHAALSGVLSALLAKQGFTGAHKILDGREGFFYAMAGLESDSTLFKHLLNDHYHILDIYFKKYPICRHLHSCLDALIPIFKKIEADEVREIIVETYSVAAEHDNFHPSTIESLKQSLPAVITIALKKKDVNLESLKIPAKSEYPHINIRTSEELDKLYPDKRPSQVTVITKNTNYQARVDLAKGEPEKPYSIADIKNKFIKLNPHLNVEVLEILEDLESYNIRDVMRFFNSQGC